MKTFKPVIERTVQDVSCVIKLDSGEDIIMCGEIVNGNVKANVAPTFHQQKEFDALEDDIKLKLTELAYNNFRYSINFCPHCGKDIRWIVISKEEFDKLK